MSFRWLFSMCGIALFAIGCSQTDTGITASVKSRLIGDDQVRASEINVDTKDRVVTLTGQVRSSDEEARAMQLARNTQGVTDVVDRLQIVPEQTAATTGLEESQNGTHTAKGEASEAGGKVKQGAEDVGEKAKEGVSKTGEAITDGWITTKVKADMVGEDLLKDSDINVDTNNHVVTLKGRVVSAAGRTRAVEIAKKVDGVHQVVDRLKVAPKPRT